MDHVEKRWEANLKAIGLLQPTGADKAHLIHWLRPQAPMPAPIPQGAWTKAHFPSVELMPYPKHIPPTPRVGHYVRPVTTAQAVFRSTYGDRFSAYAYCKRHEAYHGNDPDNFNYCPWQHATTGEKLRAIEENMRRKPYANARASAKALSLILA
jgi:hypothetical protein